MRTLMLTLLLTTTSAFAVNCPNLTGKYLKCTSTTGETEGSSDFEVSQKLVNGYNHYTLSYIDDGTQERRTDLYKADGRTYVDSQQDPETGLTLKVDQRTTCGNGQVVSRSNIWLQNESLGSLTVTVTKSGKVLTQIVEGTMMGESVKDTVLCE